MDGGTRGGHGWVALCYFFLGALLGLVVLTISAVVVAVSLVAGGGEVIAGAVLSALVGGAVLYFHLTEGLKRSRSEAAPTPVGGPPSAGSDDAPTAKQRGSAPLWPSAAYFRVGALVGLIAAVSGAVGLCGAIAAALFGSDVPAGAFDNFSTSIGRSVGEDFARSLLITGVGLLVMWWHLNEARKRDR